MLIALHRNARTTPAVRAEIAASSETAPVLAQRYGITEQTVYKWKKREVFGDRPHTAHRLQTVLTPAQEVIVVHLRRTLLLPLDDLLAVTREFLCPDVSRSGLDRCLRRHGAGNLNALKPREPAQTHKAFKSYEPGYVHVDVKYLPQMHDESNRRYLFVAIDRATRWVFVQPKANKTAASAQAFLKALHKACAIRISKVLTDNGKEFTDRLFTRKEREPSGNHEFDRLCQELGIEHRLTQPRTPRTNGMVERFNGRIADVLKTHRFNGREDLEQTLLRYVALYNQQLPQSALGSKTPMQAMKNWYQTHPHLFHKRLYDRPGCDSYIAAQHQPSDGTGEPAWSVPLIAQAARAEGVKIVAPVAVRGIETQGGQVSHVVTERGAVRASRVVVAGGAWSRLFAGNLGVSLPQLGIASPMQRISAVDGLPGAGAGSDFAWRRHADGEYSIGIQRHVAPVTLDNFKLLFDFLPSLRHTNDLLTVRFGRDFFESLRLPTHWRNDEVTPFEQTRMLTARPLLKESDQWLAYAARAVPAFAKAKVLERWGGVIDATPDATPVISDVPTLPGLFVNTGFSGGGFTLGTGAGHLLAEVIAGEKPSADPSIYRLARFTDGSPLVFRH